MAVAANENLNENDSHSAAAWPRVRVFDPGIREKGNGQGGREKGKGGEGKGKGTGRNGQGTRNREKGGKGKGDGEKRRKKKIGGKEKKITDTQKTHIIVAWARDELDSLESPAHTPRSISMNTQTPAQTQDQTQDQTSSHVLTLRRRNPARSTNVSLASATVEAAVSSLRTDVGLLQALLSAIIDEAILAIAARAGDLPPDDGARYPMTLAPTDILAEVTRLHLPWVTGDELAALWEASPTRAAIYDHAKWTANRGYRLAFERYKFIVLSLAGKATRLEVEDIAWVRSKWVMGNVEMDRFVTRRLAQMDAALQREVEAVDRDAF